MIEWVKDVLLTAEVHCFHAISMELAQLKETLMENED